MVFCHCFPHCFTSLSLNRLSYSFVTCWVGMRSSSHWKISDRWQDRTCCVVLIVRRTTDWAIEPPIRYLAINFIPVPELIILISTSVSTHNTNYFLKFLSIYWPVYVCFSQLKHIKAFNPFTAIGPENFLRAYLNSQITSEFLSWGLYLWKVDSMQFNLLVVSLYKNVVFYEKKNT